MEIEFKITSDKILSIKQAPPLGIRRFGRLGGGWPAAMDA